MNINLPFLLKNYSDLSAAHSKYHMFLDLIRGNKDETASILREKHLGLHILFKDYHAILRKYKQKYNLI